VGYQKLVITSKDTSSEDFPVALVYPTKTSSENVSFGPFELKLAIGASIATRAKGKFPLVIISHGSGGTNLGHRSIAFALVKKGLWSACHCTQRIITKITPQRAQLRTG